MKRPVREAPAGTTVGSYKLPFARPKSYLLLAASRVSTSVTVATRSVLASLTETWTGSPDVYRSRMPSRRLPTVVVSPLMSTVIVRVREQVQQVLGRSQELRKLFVKPALRCLVFGS